MKKDINGLLDDFTSVKVLSIGDIMLDRFVQGKVERISPEAPVPVFQFVQEKKMLGGAGNVIANLNSLGCKTVFMGQVGQDDFGEKVKEMLHELKTETYLIQRTDVPTIMKARFVAGNNHILRFDKEKISPLTEEQQEELLLKLKGVLPSVDIVLLSDYAKGFLSTETTQRVISLCNQAKKRVLVDPKGSDYSKYKSAFLIKPNRKELEQASGCVLDVSSEIFLSDVSHAARIILEKYSIENIIVTLSEKGMLFVSSGADVQEIYLPTFAREVFDVSGAGDTSLATLGIALAANADIRQAMELANLASGIVVGKLGTATVSLNELKQALKKPLQ
ncbi:MAG: D-glycero-beta-D-manno-heptose-7-phosphate kinase [Alphaproteobacteria bacterium]|nr:D-glycero-beta-D-manno-heptose-7-phosphate kinase [Alphaproteobacteria bacterium]